MAFVFLKKPILQKIELKTKVACQKRLGCFDFNTRAFEQPWVKQNPLSSCLYYGKTLSAVLAKKQNSSRVNYKKVFLNNLQKSSLISPAF
jgi:hypothetical protein